MKNYTLETNNLHGSSVIIRENKAIIEISCQLDTDKPHQLKYRTEYRSTARDYSFRLLRWEGDTVAYWINEDRAREYVSNAAIVAAKRQLYTNLKALQEKVNKGKEYPAWHAMREAVENNVKHFKGDFYFHDTYQLADIKDRFVWIVRTNGTHMLTNSESFSFDILDHVAKSGEAHRFYLVAGPNIQEVDATTAREAAALL